MLISKNTYFIFILFDEIIPFVWKTVIFLPSSEFSQNFQENCALEKIYQSKFWKIDVKVVSQNSKKLWWFFPSHGVIPGSWGIKQGFLFRQTKIKKKIILQFHKINRIWKLHCPSELFWNFSSNLSLFKVKRRWMDIFTSK